MTVTIKDIAVKAGVSVITVSRAINNKPDINIITKERILKIADELGYVPNELAKSLVTRRTNSIAVLMPSTPDYLAIEKFVSINQVCYEAGYTTLFCDTQNSVEKELEFLRQVKSKRVDGILIFPVQGGDKRYIDELKNTNVPFVFLHRFPEELDCDYVKNDNEYGGYITVNHLLEQGCRNIKYICARPNTTTGRERISGGKKAVSENSISSDCFEVLVCDDSIHACYAFVKSLISDKSKQKPDALFVWNDRLAIGARKAILEEGLKIPEDIALMGYDDLEVSEFLLPPLTSVRQSTYEIGRRASQILLEKIESSDNKRAIKKITIKPELIIRESTKKNGAI